MANKSKSDWRQRITKGKWSDFVLALIFIAVAYGFASLAIDSGSLLEYALSILFLLSAAKAIRLGVRNLRRK